MVKIVASQNTYIAQLEGRIQQMEKHLSDETNTQQKDQQPPAKPKTPPKRQHLAVVKPINAQSSSANTRNLVQKNIDVNRLKIGVKKVSPIKNGGILIETVEEADLATLVKELESNENIAKDFTVAKSPKRKPQFICYGVSEETTADSVKASIVRQCEMHQEDDIKLSTPTKVQGGPIESSRWPLICTKTLRPSRKLTSAGKESQFENISDPCSATNVASLVIKLSTAVRTKKPVQNAVDMTTDGTTAKCAAKVH
ncbi:hypothetical protein CDAR_77381 [Caerostris darwini]|uniref:Uncharacterized protein n=1 Tax=Caerostris darwini TaxID=1538125 RepID=A0AAV4N6Z6_9ARAC|nr:hypothetical protein CDAR_77381 [Caerostris darwini]